MSRCERCTDRVEGTMARVMGRWLCEDCAWTVQCHLMFQMGLRNLR